MKRLDQIYKIVVNLEETPRNLKLCNAYIDQFLMNFAYETMPASEQTRHMEQIITMISKFDSIRGRF